MQRQRMRIAPPGAPLDWKTLAITAEDPVAFAAELQQSLQELTDAGFHIVSQMPRGGALIVTASRPRNSITGPDAPETQAPPPLPLPSARRRIVEQPARATGQTTEEVLYHWLEPDNGDLAQRQRSFSTLVDALKLVKEHLLLEHILPLNITTVSMTRFEPDTFLSLLDMFKEDLG